MSKRPFALRWIACAAVAASVSIIPSHAQFLADPGFETPQIAPNSFQYPPVTGSAWNFRLTATGAGILMSTNSPFGNPQAPEGNQVAAVQNGGVVDQLVDGWEPGTSYRMTISAAQRTANNQTIRILLKTDSAEDVLIGEIQPSGTAYADYTTPPFRASAATHTIWFEGVLAGDQTAFFDNIRIEPGETLEGAYVSQFIPLYMKPGQRLTGYVQYRNTGSRAWTNGAGANPVRLGTADPMDRVSPFFTTGDWISNTRPTALDTAEVAEGETGRFTFDLTAPTTEGVYQESFQLVREGEGYFGNASPPVTITVMAGAFPLDAQVVNQSFPATMTGDALATAWVELKNTGTETWTDAGGLMPVYLAGSDPYGRNSAFLTPGDWRTTSQATGPDVESVAPGETARFTFVLTAPLEPGAYTEKFQLVEPETGYFGPVVTATINVEPRAAMGDVNLSGGAPDRADVETILKVAGGLLAGAPPSARVANGDFNADGKLTLHDVFGFFRLQSNPYNWEFNTDGDNERWIIQADVQNMAVAGGKLSGTAVTGDPGFTQTQRLFLDARFGAEVDVKFTASAAGRAQLFWTTQDFAFREDWSQSLPVEAGDNTLRFTVAPMTEPILSLRLDPNNVPGDFAIDYIRVFRIQPQSLPLTWDFSTPGDAGGWQPDTDLTDFVVAGGTLQTQSTGGDPYMTVGGTLKVDATAGVVVDITMQSSIESEAQLYWAASRLAFAEGNSAKLPVEAGVMKTYSFTIPAMAAPLVDLRLDPVRAPADLVIDSIVIRKP